MNTQHQKSTQSGFTLVETMIALFLFIILMTITGDLFLDGLRNQRRAFALQALMENMSLITESITKEVRVAETIYTADSACPSAPSSRLSFKHPILGDITYELQANKLIKTVGGVSDTLNSQSISMSSLGFCIIGNSLGDGRQARVVVFGKIISGQNQQQVLEVPFETLISPRLIND